MAPRGTRSEPHRTVPLDRRRVGLLLALRSLPGPGPTGTLGPAAEATLEWMADAGISVWQLLPVGPPHADGSPYQCQSASAGDPALLDLEDLAAAARLPAPAAEIRRSGTPGWRAWVRTAREGFAAHAGPDEHEAFARFLDHHRGWLEDFVLFRVIREQRHGEPWWRWPAALRDRRAAALEAIRRAHAEDLADERYLQFAFDAQWRRLRQRAADHGIRLFGDLPLYVAHDGADLWARRECFRVDPEGHTTHVAGVPPDYFSAQGQRWGNPLYDWERMRAEGYQWWVERVQVELERFDLLRIDHFRGLDSYWEIPAEAPSAVEGRWLDGPGTEFFEALEASLGPLPLVAEDLGDLRPSVHALRERLGIPGMRVLQFAFDDDSDNVHLPHNHEPQCIVYPGTHDNDTALGWWQGLPRATRERVQDYLGHPGEPMPAPLLRAALASVARLAVIPAQDLLGLGSEHRMNTPGTTSGNWRWRLPQGALDTAAAARLRALARRYGRHAPR